MKNVLEGLDPKDVFKYFEELTRIPRGSGNEKGVSEYLVNFAKEQGLEVIQEECLNVIIKKPGTKGYENAPTVIIQGHMDMVCEKLDEVEHDFFKDPIQLVIDGDLIKTKGTTLGADDGIAVAMAMAVLASKDIQHPALEVFVTVDEERGMVGAFNVKPEDLLGEVLINIDSEEEGKLLTSCAGGVDAIINLPIQWIDIPEEYKAYSIKIQGLTGGHSGMEIDKCRANANKLMGRMLNALYSETDIYVSQIMGGAKVNAIPRTSETVILVNTKDTDNVEKIICKYRKNFKNEYKTSDPNIEVIVENVDKPAKMFSKEVTNKVIKLLKLIPNGIQSMSADIDGLVESSTNLGVVVTNDEKVVFNNSLRSSVRSLRYSIQDKFRALTEILGVEVIFKSDYPEWEYNPNSQLKEICINTYEEMFNKKPEIEAIHAGLECGLFKEILGDMDMISLGPNMGNVHTPQEYLSVSSTERTYEFLKGILKNLKN
jgi:dipeptidase D